MKRLAFIVALILFPVSALAQNSTASSTEQALGAKLMQELQNSLSCGANLITAQRELATAQAKIKELEAKIPTSGK